MLNHHTARLTVCAALFAATLPKADAQVGGGPPVQLPSNSVMVHPPVPSPGINIFSDRPFTTAANPGIYDGHFHFPSGTWIYGPTGEDCPDNISPGLFDDSSLVANDHTDNPLGESSLLWGRGSTKFAYVADEEEESGYYYCVVPSAVHPY